MDLRDVLLATAAAFDAAGVAYMVTGGVATMVWGETRFTADIDLVADLYAEQVSRLHEGFPDADYYFDEQMIAEKLAVRGQFNIIHPASGVKIDVSLTQATAYSATEFARRVPARVADGVPFVSISPEDLILNKLLFYREGGSSKHLRDIAGVFKLCSQPLDRGYLNHWAEQLGIADLWTQVAARIEAA